ncbi:5179_t:CDS:2 [Funneliformis caledonium]|uniref:5179_t:CDS:1 n=1 Tax=Funneliformis caledonium TaxID=1117310 RepID=A0A9N9CM27_9GLOM|nr:5179_t:CDS:2 [Funneliformis caledonium]
MAPCKEQKPENSYEEKLQQSRKNRRWTAIYGVAEPYRKTIMLNSNRSSNRNNSY